MSKYPEDFDRGEIDEALRELLDRNLISLEWDEKAQEFMFYMTEEQKTQHDLEGDLYTEI